jgi:hypothetical protein
MDIYIYIYTYIYLYIYIYMYTQIWVEVFENNISYGFDVTRYILFLCLNKCMYITCEWIYGWKYLKITSLMALM